MHLLPIYPSSGDGGFAPLTYQDVDPKFGTWEDVKALGASYDLQMECMVNHISPASKEFQDYLAKGDKSEFREMFIDWNKLWGGGPSFALASTCLLEHLPMFSSPHYTTAPLQHIVMTLLYSQPSTGVCGELDDSMFQQPSAISCALPCC